MESLSTCNKLSAHNQKFPVTNVSKGRDWKKGKTHTKIASKPPASREREESLRCNRSLTDLDLEIPSEIVLGCTRQRWRFCSTSVKANADTLRYNVDRCYVQKGSPTCTDRQTFKKCTGKTLDLQSDSSVTSSTRKRQKVKKIGSMENFVSPQDIFLFKEFFLLLTLFSSVRWNELT